MSGIVIEPFAGPGGASEGMKELGIDAIGIEWDEAACATRAAAGHRTIRADVSKVPTAPFRGKVTGVWGSPPCPTFSSAGDTSGLNDMPWLLSFLERVYRTGCWHEPWEWHGWADPRTPLVLEPLRFALDLDPEWVVLEQVPNALPVFESIGAILDDRRYSVWVGVLNAADYGVPQTRRRAILLASRVRVVTPPAPTHSASGHDSLFGGHLPWVSMAEALGWQGGVVLDRRQTGAPTIDVDRHPCPTLTSAAVGKTVWVLRTGANSMKHSRITADIVPYEREISRPAPTVDTKAGSAWTVDKGGDLLKLTTIDGSIIQGFRADYPWQGNRTAKWQQIGNAVPPPLAAACVAQVTPAGWCRPTGDRT